MNQRLFEHCHSHLETTVSFKKKKTSGLLLQNVAHLFLEEESSTSLFDLRPLPPPPQSEKSEASLRQWAAPLSSQPLLPAAPTLAVITHENLNTSQPAQKVVKQALIIVID